MYAQKKIIIDIIDSEWSEDRIEFKIKNIFFFLNPIFL